MSENNYIILHFQCVRGATVEGILREGIEKKFAHIKVLDNSFYNFSLIEKSQKIIELLDPHKTNYIIFSPGVFLFSVSASLLKIIKNIQPKPICILHLVDSIDRIADSVLSLDELNNFFNMFDYTFTADLYEVKKYGFLHHHGSLKTFPYLKSEKSEQYGLLFLGRAKGREQFLFDIARYLQKNNIIYNFYLFAPNLVIPSDILSIHLLKERISYQDVVQKYVHNCSCRLALISKNSHGVSAAVHEAILYNKKVICSCDCFEEYPYYDARFMRKISKAEDIDIDWLKDSTPVHYDYDKTHFRIDCFLDDVAKIIEEKKDTYKITLTSSKQKQIRTEPQNDPNAIYSLSYKDLKKYWSAYRIYFKSDCGQRFKDEDVLFFKADTVIEMFSGIWQGSNLCTLGSFSYICSQIQPFMQIGRYVSIDSGLSILPDGHPWDWISTSPFTYFATSKFFNIPLQTSFGKFLSPIYQPEQNKIVIENDVWIGKNVSLKKGLRICNGAVIQHNAVVTEDVPPYAIVSGSPAKVIGFRFKQDIIDSLLQLQWWRYNISDLNGLHFNDIELFLDEFSKLKSSLEPFVPLTFQPFHVYTTIMSKKD